MYKRTPYIINHTGLSTKNEPSSLLNIEACVRQYPDMFLVYQTFCSFFNVHTQNVILSNGCENSLKSVLLALYSHELTYGIPSWGMIEVICQQCRIKTKTSEFKLENNIAIDIDYNDIDIYYTTYYANNVFNTKLNMKNINKSNVTIVDISYVNINTIKYIFNKFDYDGKIIYIGSFDKMIGCGLRCGFALFPTKYINDIQLQREQYINALAAKFIQNINNFCFTQYNLPCVINTIKKYHKYIVANTNNYITLLLPNNINFSILNIIPHKTFQCNGKNFVRFGIPSNYDENVQLINVLEKICI